MKGAAAAAAAVFAGPAFAVKRRPTDTLDNMKRARGNVAKIEKIFDSQRGFGFEKRRSASEIAGAVLADFKPEKNAEMAEYCKSSAAKNIKYCAFLGGAASGAEKFLADEFCAAVSVGVPRQPREILNLEPVFAMAAAAKKPVYILHEIFADKNSADAAFAGAGAAKALFYLIESGIFRRLPELKIVLQSAGAEDFILKYISRGRELPREIFQNIFYLLDSCPDKKILNLILGAAPKTQFLFASGLGGENSPGALEEAGIGESVFEGALYRNAYALFPWARAEK